MREIEVVVASRPRVGRFARDAVERRDKLPVLRDESVLPRPIPQELTGRVVQTEDALPEFEFEQEREVVQPAQ